MLKINLQYNLEWSQEKKVYPLMGNVCKNDIWVKHKLTQFPIDLLSYNNKDNVIIEPGRKPPYLTNISIPFPLHQDTIRPIIQVRLGMAIEANITQTCKTKPVRVGQLNRYTQTQICQIHG